MMEYEVALTNLRFHAGHGVWEQENRIGNEFIVEVRIRIPYSDDFLSDNLDLTISYADLYKIVAEEMSRPRKLLETVAAHIHSKIAGRWNNIISGSIKICKSTPPIAHISGSAEVSLFF